VGILTRNFANISSSAIGTSVTALQNSPRLRAVVEDSLGAGQLKAPTGTVVAGLTQRLLRGDTDSASTFLAAQAGIPKAEAQNRISTLSANFKTTLTDISQKASEGASRLGWATFITLFLGTVAAMLGGGTGAMVNLRKPLDRVDERAMRRIPAYT
jgi:hypothetical protein